ncbi:MAG TPA: UbiA-like polyprenyltransferase [Phycisphaerae bacterium]|nr:UbiA-like polyprenyltransferase [Phycisphaerae bacterium]HRW52531.1 UbiA-like polyprenyltransferase [Phycisphaerae bacterium]
MESSSPGAGIVGATRTWGEMIKFSHSVFALPFALIATFLAARSNPTGLPSMTQLLLIVLCMVAARSFAMTFNRIADRLIDARNPRTATRPLVSGRITLAQAWIFLVISAVVFIAGCVGFLVFCDNPWPLWLSAPTLALLAIYSYMKRVTPLAHFVLGVAIAFAPSAAWVAIAPQTYGVPALLLTGCVLFWIAGFDIIYACQDIDSDRRDGLKSVPARLGIAGALWVSRGCHVVTVGLLVAFGVVVGLAWLFWAAAIVTAILLAAEQSVVRPTDLSRVNLAFFTLNGCVSLLLGLATISDILWLGN